MPTVYIGIGSNLGDREAHCREAIEKLRAKGLLIKKTSLLYETEPWGVKEQPPFINMAIEVETSLSPEALLATLKQIEHEMGRAEGPRWGPRVIDLDILLYDDIVVDMEQLKIPHPLLHTRRFVLLPLSEIAPDTQHPLFHKSVRQLKEGLE